MQLIWRKKGDPSVRRADLFLTIRPDLVQSSSRKYTLGDHHVYGLVILIFLSHRDHAFEQVLLILTSGPSEWTPFVPNCQWVKLRRGTVEGGDAVLFITQSRQEGVDGMRASVSEEEKSCSRNIRDIESGSWERWLRWRWWQMIICKRPIPPDDHFQVAGSSGSSLASGRILRMIICKTSDPPNDHLKMAGPSRCSLARGRILRIIIFKGRDPQDDHLHKAGSSGWSFARRQILQWSFENGWILRMNICIRQNPLDDHFQDARSSK